MRTHGWGNQGGAAVAANSRYLYLGAAMENEGGAVKAMPYRNSGMDLRDGVTDLPLFRSVFAQAGPATHRLAQGPGTRALPPFGDRHVG